MEKWLYSSSSVLFSRKNLPRQGNYEVHGALVIGLTPVYLAELLWGSAQFTSYLSNIMSVFILHLSPSSAPCGSDIILVLCRCIIELSVWLVTTLDLNDPLTGKSGEQNSGIAFQTSMVYIRRCCTSPGTSLLASVNSFHTKSSPFCSHSLGLSLSPPLSLLGFCFPCLFPHPLFLCFSFP